MVEETNKLAYQGKIEAQLKEWGSQIDRWQDQAGDAIAPYMTEVNRKRQSVITHLSTLKSAGDSDWTQHKPEMEQAVSEMHQVMNQVRAQVQA